MTASRSVPSRIVEVDADQNFTLARTDNGHRFVAITSLITITLPAIGVLGDGFECEVVNDSGGTMIIAATIPYQLNNGDIAKVLEVNAKQRVVIETQRPPTDTEVPKSADFTLAPGDSGRRFVATSPLTCFLPNPTVLGNGFKCEVVNDSGDDVVVNGRGVTDVTLSDGHIARVYEVNSKQRVVDVSSTLVGDLFSPGDPYWDPSVFGLDFDLIHWWDAGIDIVLDASSSLVSSWSDKVRIAPATQLTAARQPAWQNNDEVRFDGQSIGMTTGNYGRAGFELKWFMLVFRINWTTLNALGKANTFFWAVDGATSDIGQKQPLLSVIRLTHQLKIEWYSNGGLLSLTVDVPGADDTWHSLIGRRTDDGIFASIDGAAEDSLVCYPRGWASGQQGFIGNPTTSPGNNPTNIGIDTLIWGQREISSDEIAAAHAWALWKRGAEASLDASSPYLLDRPLMSQSDIHVAEPDSWADGYRFPASGGWDDTVKGDALDLTGFTRVFHDHFTDINTITDGFTGAGPWWAPAHQTTSNAVFNRPGVAPLDTFTILPDNTTLQIKMSQINNTGTMYSGHIQTVDAWRNTLGTGFTQAVPDGGFVYWEAKLGFNLLGGNAIKGFVSPSPSWPAFWLYTILDNRDSAATKSELDIVEAYGDNSNGNKQIHIASHRHSAYRPQPGNVGSPGNQQGSLGHTPSKIQNVTVAPYSATAIFDGAGDGNPGTMHTYGLMIDETWTTWYFDGLIVSRFATFKEALGEHYAIVSLQSQDVTGKPNVENYMWVDYVDCYVKS